MKFIGSDNLQASVTVEPVALEPEAEFTYSEQWVQVRVSIGRYYGDTVLNVRVPNEDELIRNTVQLGINNVIAVYQNRRAHDELT